MRSLFSRLAILAFCAPTLVLAQTADVPALPEGVEIPPEVAALMSPEDLAKMAKAIEDAKAMAGSSGLGVPSTAKGLSDLGTLTAGPAITSGADTPELRAKTAGRKAAKARLDRIVPNLIDYVPGLKIRTTPFQYARDCTSAAASMSVPVGRAEINQAYAVKQVGGTWRQKILGFNNMGFWEAVHEEMLRRDLADPMPSDAEARRLAELALTNPKKAFENESQYLENMFDPDKLDPNGLERAEYVEPFFDKCRIVRRRIMDAPLADDEYEPSPTGTVIVILGDVDPLCVPAESGEIACTSKCETDSDDRLFCPVEVE